MKIKKIIIISIIGLVAVLIIEIIAYIPYFMVGPPLEVFGINNRDLAKHNINVQVVDSTNKILINKTYDLNHSQTISYPENGWKDVHEKDRLFPNGNYTFIVTLDGNVTESYKELVDTWSLVDISIENKGNIRIGRLVT